MIRWNAAKYGSVAGALWSHFTQYIGILGLLAPFGWRRSPQLIRDATRYLVPCCLAALTASDWGRLFIPALPVLVALRVPPSPTHDPGEVPSTLPTGPEQLTG